MNNTGPRTLPLLRLGQSERDRLINTLTIEARNNVTNNMNLTKSDPGYKLQVSLETNRLINVWIDSNQ